MISMLMASPVILSKTPKLYRCQQADGREVVQDRRCVVTQLQTANSSQSKPIKPKPKPKVLVATNKGGKAVGSKPRTTNGSQARSPFFVFGWDRFLPANWMLVKEQVGSTQHLMLSKTRFNGSNDFMAGIKLSVYSKTMKSQRQGAFALALSLYHQIREQYSEQLIDSQFKTHQRYKIFNIGYRVQNSFTALTEFYIDESNNDLFVLTIQSPQSNWQLHQQLANQITSNL